MVKSGSVTVPVKMVNMAMIYSNGSISHVSKVKWGTDDIFFIAHTQLVVK